jgi:hypothetical protein
MVISEHKDVILHCIEDYQKEKAENTALYI